MRTFIAIELPKEIKERLALLQDEFKNAASGVRWVEPNNIHLTIKFLGEIQQQKINEISNILDDAVKKKNSFYIRVFSCGVFPNLNFPRVIWVGIDKGDIEVKVLAGDLQEKLSKIGIPKEKRDFTSHITIGRIKTASRADKLIQKLNESKDKLKKEGLEFKVCEIVLFKSTLTPRGAVYEPLKTASLATA